MIVNKAIMFRGNINTALGTNETDEGLLCTHANINIWAKYKPVRHSETGELTLSQRQSVNFGLLFDTFLKIRLKQAWDTGILPYHEGDTAWVQYLKPRGISQPEWYRILDFDGYQSDAPMPFSLSDQDGIASNNKVSGTRNYAWAFFDDNALGGNALNYQEMTAKDGSTVYQMSQMYPGVAMFVTAPEYAFNPYVCVGVGIAKVGNSYMKLQSLHAVRQDEIDSDGFPQSSLGKIWFEYDINPSDLPAMFEDYNNNPCKRSTLYLRPLLSPVDGSHIAWDGTHTDSVTKFLPLRTLSDIVNNVRIDIRNQIFIYCDIRCNGTGFKDGDYWFDYTFNLRIGNTYAWDPVGAIQKVFTITNLQIRMYPTLEDYENDPCDGYVDSSLYACDRELENLTDKASTPLYQWQLDPWYSSGSYPTNTWRNNFAHYDTQKYTLQLTQHQRVAGNPFERYNYFRVLAIGYSAGWSPSVVPVIQNGRWNDNIIEFTGIEPS